MLTNAWLYATIVLIAIIIFIYDVLTNENKINENNTQLLN